MIQTFTKLCLTLFALSILCQAQPPAGLPPVPETKQAQPTPTPQEEVGEGDVVRISANLISVPVTVLNRQGQYVVDLQQGNFKIFEDDVPQSIAHFSNVDRPFSVVLLIDTSSSTAPFLDQIKVSAKVFVEQLRSLDKVRPVYFHGEIKSLTRTATNDVSVLRDAIDQMEAGSGDLGTRLYDAVDFSLNALRPEQTRKAVILFTDGENTWGKATMKATLAAAEESEVIFYTLQYGALPAQKYLQQLADRTGGRYFKAGDISLIRQSFVTVADELRRQYLIGYYPGEHRQDGKERMIKVKVDRKNVTVRARRSYTSGRP